MDVNTSPGAGTFDQSELVRRLMGDEALAKQIIEGFVEEANEHLVRLRRAVRDRDASSVHRLGHAMKGAAGSVGARGLSEVFARLEAAGRDGHLHDAASCVDVAWEGLREVEHALRPLSAEQTGGDE